MHPSLGWETTEPSTELSCLFSLRAQFRGAGGSSGGGECLPSGLEVQYTAMKTKKDSVQVCLPLEDSCTGIPWVNLPPRWVTCVTFPRPCRREHPKKKAWLAFALLPPECMLVDHTVGTQSGLSVLRLSMNKLLERFPLCYWEPGITPTSLPPRGRSERRLNKAHGIAYNTIKDITIVTPFRIWERSRDKFRYQGSWAYFLICVDFDAITMQIL